MKEAEAGSRSEPGSRRIVVVGAGVSGLAAAFTAATEHDGDEPLDVLVLERGDRIGGRARAEEGDGWLIEAGPGGYLDTEPEVARLVEAAGVRERLVRADAAAARRFILFDDRLHQVGPHPIKMWRSGLLGLGSLARAAAEVFVPARREEGEESIRDFAARRFGPTVADRLVRTALLGVFAGDASRLSVDACFPRLRDLEREYRSVILGGIRTRAGRSDGDGSPTRQLTSFRAGLQELPRALARAAGVRVRLGASVRRLRVSPTLAPSRGSLEVELRSGERIAADAVVVATSAGPASSLLAEVAPTASARLAEIESPPVVVVALGYRRESVAALPSGFGTLVARGEGYRMLGVLQESWIYPDRAPDGHALLRVMYGGSLDEEVTRLDDIELQRLASSELERAFGLVGEPALGRVFRWPRAIPQYEIGHVALRREAEAALARVPGLFLAGDSLEGVSFVKTAATGIRKGREALASVDQPGS